MKKKIGKLAILICLMIPFSLWATINIDFDSALDTVFPGYTWHQSNIHFNYGGNSFEWVVFPTTGTFMTETGNVLLSGWAMITWCTHQVEWLYYNNSRWLLVWPLDLNTLTGLRSINTWYENMSLTGWLFYDCYGVDPTNVYGQVNIDLFGVEYKIIAWLNYDFSNNTYFNSFSGSLSYSWGMLSGYIFDNYGGIGRVYEPPVIPLIGSVEWLLGWNYINNSSMDLRIETNKQDVIFSITWDVINIGWTMNYNTILTIQLSWSDGLKNIYTKFEDTKWNIVYDHYTIILDTTPPTKPELLTPVNWSLVNDLVDFSWGVSVDSGAGINEYVFFITQWLTTIKEVNLGNANNYSMLVYPEGTAGSVLVSWSVYNRHIKTYDKLWQYSTTVSNNFTAGYTALIDVVPPTMPQIIRPVSTWINTDITFERTASTDTGVGLDNYEFKIYNTSWWTVLLSWFSSTTNITFANSYFNTWNYYWWVRAFDLSGNVSSTDYAEFSTVPTPDITPNTFSFNSIDDAKRDKLYKSNEITVKWLGTGVSVLAEINRWALFIDGNFVGLSGMVSNGSGIWIELISSDDYNTTRSSTLVVGNKSATFYIDTERKNNDDDDDDDDDNDDDDYSDFLDDLFDHSPRLEVMGMFNNLVDIYEDESLNKRKQFFHAFWVNLKDEITVLEYKIRLERNDADRRELQKKLYVVDTLHDLIFWYLMHELGYAHEVLTLDLDKNGKYIAPNGKTYYISVRDDWALYSTTFKTRKYFPTRLRMKKFIDERNPNLWHYSNDNNTIVTPSGKVYHIVYDPVSMTFYSPDSYSQRHFEDLRDLHVRLDINNPGIWYWNHTLDPTYTTVMYQTLNGKYYALKKTMDNRYFSPFFTSAKYFPSEKALIEHIDAHNRR